MTGRCRKVGRLATRAGIEKQVHPLRHAHAAHLSRSQVPVAYIQRQLGPTSLSRRATCSRSTPPRSSLPCGASSGSRRKATGNAGRKSPAPLPAGSRAPCSGSGGSPGGAVVSVGLRLPRSRGLRAGGAVPSSSLGVPSRTSRPRCPVSRGRRRRSRDRVAAPGNRPEGAEGPHWRAFGAVRCGMSPRPKLRPSG